MSRLIFHKLLSCRFVIVNRICKLSNTFNNFGKCVYYGYFGTAVESPNNVLTTGVLKTLSFKLNDQLNRVLNESNLRFGIKFDGKIRIGLITPLSNVSVAVISSLLSRPNIALAFLPLPTVILKDDLNIKLNDYLVRNTLKNLIVEGTLNLILTSSDYYTLTSQICKELLIPIAIFNNFNLSTEDEYISHMTSNYILGNTELNRAVKVEEKGIECIEEHEGNGMIPCDLMSMDSEIYIFDDFSTANSKVVTHFLRDLSLEIEKFKSVIEFNSSDNITNCLHSHEYSSFIHGILVPLSCNSQITLPPSLDINTIIDTLSYSTDVTYILCSLDTLTLLCDEVLRGIEINFPRNIIVISSVLEMNKLDNLMEDVGIKSDVIELITIPEAGIIASRFVKDGSSYTFNHGVEITEDLNKIVIKVKSSNIFKGYYNRVNYTRGVMDGEVFTKVIEKVDDTTRLLENHKDYVLYFKKKRDKMKKFPQGYIKKVPLKTQFWGNFTGKNKHHSVL